MNDTNAAARFDEFRALHRSGAPLVLPNAWDHASAAALVAAGFRAVGTTSLGVAAAAGKPDATGDTRAETLALARGLSRLDAFVSVDIEGGFAHDPAEVGALAAELAALGVVGVNLEDGRPDGSLTELDHQCAVIRAVKATAPALFLNARTDTYWLAGPGGTEETEARVLAYQEAGADGVFVPALQEPTVISALVSTLQVPLNVLYSPAGPAVPELARLGVRRVSTGSLLFRSALHAAVSTARSVAAGTPPATEGLPGYAEAAALADAFTDAGRGGPGA
ncbi:isocitrate lyase/phosphoenolpyruvate mutase family protein [Streptomyces solicathayae]|uniref:Isocitrate lyase/phosphoenolpyruvate mutase family protein n=1 Tax=Streptomyces solicathayae TaxID=3081768 RepID=A0ABZ0M3P5_9ACTN|nr:isocitrate lyase/phosphoenolpyruvate mutase family protein [Streptomyces sp. HUAS YS2]WOX26265.1 isocitrate lyase/phosphoenolpyruvate mutase family protein [Streptomyces sp. HUAS YS2]